MRHQHDADPDIHSISRLGKGDVVSILRLRPLLRIAIRIGASQTTRKRYPRTFQRNTRHYIDFESGKMYLGITTLLRFNREMRKRVLATQRHSR